MDERYRLAGNPAVIGFGQTGRLLFVVNIEMEDACIRIISARAANAGEEKLYAY